MLFVFVLKTLCTFSAAVPQIAPRARRFGPMGGPSGGSPFHAPGGGMTGMMGGPMQGMGPSMGGPNGQGQGSSMFHPSGVSCIRHNIVCPQWCLVVDEHGCRSCPCGPAGGMAAIAGGPSGGPMSLMSRGVGGAMASMGGNHAPISSGSQVTSETSGSAQGNTLGVNAGGGTGGGAIISSTSSSSGGSSTVYVNRKPVKECAAALLCTSTCTSGYTLGSHSSNGCRSCSCSSNHEISTTTIHYITQVVKPPTKQCTVTSHCMNSCTNGYIMSTTDNHGCPVCTCQNTYTPPIEIAVEPPPIDELIVGRPQTTYTLICAATSCNMGCSVGYKCGRDGCPTCECIHPSVVGMTTLQVFVQRPVQCLRPLSCPSSCEIGYRCDSNGCPTCECVIKYTTQTQHYSVQTCSHTLTCAATCTNGYEVIKGGAGTCDKCVCKQNVIYAVQRPQPPKYEIVQCPSTSTCSAKCAHGFDIIKYENACPECKCKPAPLYYTITSGCQNGCETSGSQTVYLTGGSSSSSLESSYYINGASSGDSGLPSVSANAGTYITARGAKGESGTSESSIRSGGNNGGILFQFGGESCPPLPPDCNPSCIKYDTPHCRKCICESAYIHYGSG